MYILRRVLNKVVRFNNWVFTLFSIFFIFFSALFFYIIEPKTFTTYFTSLWYVMTTVTTVGYGDVYPVTTVGRIGAMILYLVGIGIGGILIGKVVDGLGSYRKRKEEGLVTYHGENHIVIIGWSSKSEVAIEEILETDSKIQVVVIDRLEKAPFLKERVHYVRGMAAEDKTLEQANLKKAKAAIIFADDSIEDKQLTDGKTLLIATSLERLAPNVHTMVEIMNERNVKNFHYVDIDEFILPNDTMSRLAVRAIFTDGIASVYNQLVRRGQGENLYYIKKKAHWQTYQDAYTDLIQKGATLVSNGDDLTINRKLNQSIPDDARLYVICDDLTYDRIKI